MSETTKHTEACRWTRNTQFECEYNLTHYFCPHPEHECDCGGLTPPPPPHPT